MDNNVPAGRKRRRDSGTRDSDSSCCNLRDKSCSSSEIEGTKRYLRVEKGTETLGQETATVGPVI